MSFKDNFSKEEINSTIGLLKCCSVADNMEYTERKNKVIFTCEMEIIKESNNKKLDNQIISFISDNGIDNKDDFHLIAISETLLLNRGKENIIPKLIYIKEKFIL